MLLVYTLQKVLQPVLEVSVCMKVYYTVTKVCFILLFILCENGVILWSGGMVLQGDDGGACSTVLPSVSVAKYARAVVWTTPFVAIDPAEGVTCSIPVACLF